jgi:asparagine synthase (glutamine-hydrolysing)
MCGIAGVAGFQDIDNAEAIVHKMSCALARRGPDAEGITRLDGAVLGHRRLSIFDLSAAGIQPMTTPDRAVSVVFNGAIYNFRELRPLLESAGYRFQSQTDTEVLLHGYREWGIDQLVARLRGMFAFGLWDNRNRKLFLVRDRLGVKPLIYAVQGNQIAFASTPRAIRQSGLVSEIDPQAVAEFLEFGYVTDDRTIYQGVAKVQAGTIMEWSDGRLSARQYWFLPTVNQQSRVTFEDAVAETERLFLEAVKLRLDADVPVGSLLSGGVDSSLVCWAVSALGADITAFTIGAHGDPLDETADARQTARQLGIRHEVIDLSPDETPSIDDMSSAYGEPFACASALGMMRVSKAVRSSATVLLTGDGGDDVYLGYPEHRYFQMAQDLARRLPPGSGQLWRAIRPAIPNAGMLRRGAHFLDYATGGLGSVTRAHPGLNVYQQSGMLGERLASAVIPQRQIERSLDSARHLLTEFLAYDRRTRFTGEYMTKVDGGTMYHALEGRAPFLDQELWNFAATLPYSIRLRGGQLKAILRELARRRVGERVASGSKRGFSIPVNRWLAGRWRRDFAEAMSNSLLAKEGWIRSGPVLEQHRRAVEKGWVSNQLWYLYVLETWFRRELRHDPADAAESVANAAAPAQGAGVTF